MFDYIFYRLYINYKKKEKGLRAISTAAMYLSFIQLLILFSLLMIINITINGALTKNLSDLNKKILGVGIVVFFLLLDVFNYLYYKKKHKALLTKFNYHPLNKKLKIWMLYFLGIGLLLLPLFYKELLKMI